MKPKSFLNVLVSRIIDTYQQLQQAVVEEDVNDVLEVKHKVCSIL